MNIRPFPGHARDAAPDPSGARIRAAVRGVLWVASVSCLWACGEDRSGPSGTGLVTGAGSGATDGSSDQDGSSTGGSGETGSSDDVSESTSTGVTDGGIKLDVDPGMESGGGGEGSDPETCQSVDLLFIIDNSASMLDDQRRLINSFPGFVDAVRRAVAAGADMHIGVTTTDSGFVQSSLTGCTGLGVMVQETPSEVCGPYPSTGRNYFTDQDDFGANFGCAALLGDQGDNDERSIESARRALSPGFNGAGGCNEGFLREDALLVVVNITDEDDADGFVVFGESPDPLEVHEEFVGLKDGHEDNIVWLGILKEAGHPPGCDPNGNGPADWLGRFVRAFDNGIVGDICQPDFSPFFENAVERIATAFEACVPIPPVG